MKTRIILILLSVSSIIIPNAFSQNIGINANGTIPDSSAMLDVSSTTKGLLAPRMTTTQQIAILLPGKGLLIYNITNNAFMVNTGTSSIPVWTTLAFGGGSITSVNGLTAVTQTIVAGTSGTDVNMASAGSTHTFNFPDASLTARGLVTTGTQTFNGNKTFNGTINAANIASGATTDSIVTVDAVGILKKRTVANIVSGSNLWSLTGNNAISSAVNFLGSTNNASLRLRTNNLQRMVIDSFAGNVGIGTTVFDATVPNSTLQIAGSLALPLVNKTESYTITATDYTIVCNNIIGIVISLPTAVGITGRIYIIKKISGILNDVVITPVLLQTIDGALSKTLSTLNDKATLQSNGSNWIVL